MTVRRRCYFALCCWLAAAAAFAGECGPVIAILHTNDVHGHFAASDTAVGHDRVAGLFRDRRQRLPATFLLDAGDAVQGSALVKWNKGAAALDIMNAAGYDAMVLGNHEFDYGWDHLAGLAGTAAFALLTQPAVSGGEPGFEAAALFERGGRRLGVFGITTPETARSSGGGFGHDFGGTEGLIAYAGAMAESLRRAGADAVVCLAHLGVDDQGYLTSYGLRDAVPGIDVIIDGHSHTPLDDIVQAEGRALIASAGEHCEAVGLVEFYEKCGGGLRPVARAISRSEALATRPDPAVTAVIAGWAAQSARRGATVVARSARRLDGSRLAVRTRETALGNLVADALRAAASADVALVNGGNIRAALPAGDITLADIDTALPYENAVLTAAVPGGVLREALELSVSRYPEEFGGFLQVSGLEMVFDPAQPPGRRLMSVAVQGAALDDDRHYRLAVCDWLADGGDGYGMVADAFADAEKSTSAAPIMLADVVVDYLNQGGVGEASTVATRITVAE